MLIKLLWLSVLVAGIMGLFIALPWTEGAGADQTGISVEHAKVVATFPHDANDFCQGLVVEGDVVYEGTGHYGASVIKKYELPTGKVLAQTPLDANLFGEGIAILGDEIFQLTWKERVCLIYEKQTLKQIGQKAYAGKGWGLAEDGENLYLSDGSSTIQVLNRNSLKPVHKIRVHYGRRQQGNLNELEFVQGELWACIWYEDRIARIDPASGELLGWLDCSSLYPQAQRHREHVLNGIAYDAQANRLFITGKNWPSLFEIAVPKLDGKHAQ